MKTGVSTTPWLVVRRPQRAAPSVATTSKKTGLSPSTVPPRGMGSGWPNGAGSHLVSGHPPTGPGSRTPRQRAPLQQQTRVAVGVEAIARTNRVRVRLQDQLPARERRDEHEERGARQVKVRQERVHDPEAVARRDVDVGVTLERPHPPVRLGRTLERARRRGPYREDAPALDARAVHRVGDRLGNRHALGREPVVLDRRRLDGTKGPRTDVQRDLAELDAPRAQATAQGGPGRTRARQRRSSSRVKKSNSTGRPPGSRARTRAGMTRELLMTMQSPGRNRSGSSANARSSSAPRARSITRSRAASRAAAGACAIA